VDEVSVRHIGNAADRAKFAFELVAKKYSNESVSDEEARIYSARRCVIGATKAEVLDVIFGKRKLLAKRVVEAAYDACIPDIDGPPNTVWGLVQGVTRVSQMTKYADARNEMDKAAGKLLQLV
jgi:hypothetical protein